MMSFQRTLGLAAIVCLGLFSTACAGGATGGGPEAVHSDTTPAATAGIPEIVWNLPYGEPTSLDPAFSSSESNSQVVANMCESLLYQNPDFTTRDNLASVSQEDEVTYRVKLDRRAAFWDGKPVTSADVKYSIERIMDPALGSTWGTVLANIRKISIVGKHELVIKLSQPDVLFAAHLATPAAAIVEQEFAESATKLGDSKSGIMCSGPFAFGRWNIGQDIVLQKAKDYWNPDGAALSDSIKFIFNTDAASAATAMQNGEITGSYNFAVSAFDRLLKSSGTVTLGTSLGLYGLMTINTADGPLADLKIREALQYAIDYDGIRDGIFAGAADELRTFTPRSAWGYSEPIFQKAWDETEAGVTDLDRAKRLVDEVGAPDRPIVLAYYADLPEDAQVATSIQAAAKKVGLEIEVKAQTASENVAMYFDASARKGIDAMIWAGYLDVPEPVAYYQYYTSDGVFNVAGFSDAEFDSLVHDARGELDNDKRAEMITQAQSIYSKNRIDFPIASQYTRLYLAKGITGAIASQAFYYSPWAARIGTADAE